MNQSKPTISGSAVVLTNPSAVQIGTVKRCFAALFGVFPIIRIKGHFPALAVRVPESGPGSLVATGPLDLTNDWHQVHFVGRLFVKLDLGAPLGVKEVVPDRGTNVEVRFTLPKSE